MQTAQAALEGRGISPVPSPELREFAYGQWEGMTYKEVEAAYPEEYAEMLKRIEDFAPPGGGESLRDMMARIGGFVSRTKQAHSDDDTILVTGHGGSLRALLTCLMGLAPHTSWQFMLTPASLSIVDCYPGVGVLRLLNDTSHIGGQA
jgi:broad specificity phosphatase PhoE